MRQIHRFGAVGDPEFVEQVGDVCCHGAAADEQRIGDLNVGSPGGEKLQHLKLPNGETEGLRVRYRIRRLHRFRKGQCLIDSFGEPECAT